MKRLSSCFFFIYTFVYFSVNSLKHLMKTVINKIATMIYDQASQNGLSEMNPCSWVKVEATGEQSFFYLTNFESSLKL